LQFPRRNPSEVKEKAREMINKRQVKDRVEVEHWVKTKEVRKKNQATTF
jgi:hypothetical protein